MRYANRLSGVTVAIAAVVVAAVGVVTFVGVSLVAGGGQEPPPPPVLDATPEPPRGPGPTLDPDLPGGFSVPSQGPTPTWPASVEISGVVIPIPEGWHYVFSLGEGARPMHLIWKGESSSRQTESGPVTVGVRFDDFGLTYINVDPSEEAEAEATLDAIWDLTQTVMTLSPATASVAGQDVPLPAGSYYRVTEKLFIPGEVGTFRVAYRHSVLFFNEHGLRYARVASGDEARFQPAIDAIALLAAAK